MVTDRLVGFSCILSAFGIAQCSSNKDDTRSDHLWENYIWFFRKNCRRKIGKKGTRTFSTAYIQKAEKSEQTFQVCEVQQLSRYLAKRYCLPPCSCLYKSTVFRDTCHNTPTHFCHFSSLPHVHCQHWLNNTPAPFRAGSGLSPAFRNCGEPLS